MDIETSNIAASVPDDTARRVRAFQMARNGTWHNAVAELLEAGLKVKLSEAPDPFIGRFKQNWLDLSA